MVRQAHHRLLRTGNTDYISFRPEVSNPTSVFEFGCSYLTFVSLSGRRTDETETPAFKAVITPAASANVKTMADKSADFCIGEIFYLHYSIFEKIIRLVKEGLRNLCCISLSLLTVWSDCIRTV